MGTKQYFLHSGNKLGRMKGLIIQEIFIHIKSRYILKTEQLSSMSTYETELASECTLSLSISVSPKVQYLQYGFSQLTKNVTCCYLSYSQISTASGISHRNQSFC